MCCLCILVKFILKTPAQPTVHDFAIIIYFMMLLHTITKIVNSLILTFCVLVKPRPSKGANSEHDPDMVNGIS